VNVTEWFHPLLKPVRVGYFEAIFFDAGWNYEWKAWFDGSIWRNEQGGWALQDQNLTWRGLTSENGKDD
jgi:uncharacterized membrane protein